MHSVREGGTHGYDEAATGGEALLLTLRAATCLRLVLERVPDERRATRLLLPLHEWHRFLLRERDPDGLGEPVLIHPWESGRDNGPEWDRPLFRVEPRLMYVRRRDTAH